MTRSILARLTVLFLCALGLPRAAADEPKGGPPLLKRLKFRSIGPAAGGRVCRVAGVPGDPLTCYAACAMGGLWKSSDGGHHWQSLTDDQPLSSVGSLAIAPSDPNVLYIGCGEANIRGNVATGNGIFKSEDAGKTWKHVWKQTGQIGTMIVHPTNPDVAYAAILGHAFGPNEQRGVYRTSDGGKTWQRVLSKNPDIGASDVCFGSSPKVLFAGLWQTRRKPWEFTSGGPGSGLYVSRDGGDTWTQLVAPPKADAPEAGRDAPPGQKRCPGLPEGIWGKVCVAVAPSDGRRIYAMIEAEKGGLFRSDDGGDTWKLINGSRALRQRAWYFSTLTVHPANPDVVWCPQVPLLRSIDGGRTFQRVRGPHHGDHHDIWIDPKNPKRIIDCNDGGVDISLNGGETWFAPPLPIAQFYRIDVDASVPYRVMGSMQDIGTGSGPSNSLATGGILLCNWYTVGGGEAGHVVADPSDPNIVWATEYGGYLTRYDRRTRQARSVSVYPYNPSGHGAEDLKYRFQWTAPVMVSRHDPKVVYHAANVLFRSSNGGQSWAPISPDLTRNDRSKQKWSGGPITGDNTGVEIYDTIFALAESPVQQGLLWAGSDDGLVHVSRDGGKSWSNVTANIKGIPEWGTVNCIEASPYDAGTAYIVVEAHRLDDFKPYLFRTTDFGKTWRSLSAKMPQDVYLHAVRCDPKKKGLLYLGTERGVHFSTDDGLSWQELKLNFPTVAVTDLKVKDNDLVLATNGRSLWIFDDLTPLRDLTPELAKADVYLLPVQRATRYHYTEKQVEERFFGKGFANPPAGAIVHYGLERKPAGEVTLEVFDDKGTKVRTLTSRPPPQEKPAEEEGDYSAPEKKPKPLPTEAGLHRVVWDLRYDGAEVIKGAKVDAGKLEVGPLVNPGRYTLVLGAGGKTLRCTVEVKQDPRLRLPPKDAAEQLALLLRVRDDLSRLARITNQLRSLKGQIATRAGLIEGNLLGAALVKGGEGLVKKLDALEEKLHNPKARVAYDILAQRGGARLYSQLAWLFEQLKGSDGPPTQGIRVQVRAQEAMLDQYQQEWNKLLVEDVTRLNETARELKLPRLFAPQPAAAR
jgi:photosystem II stability/assembly factor-like uncharacterized protein